MRTFVGRLSFVSSRILVARRLGAIHPEIDDILLAQPTLNPRQPVRRANEERPQRKEAQPSRAHEESPRTTLPCPMCDDAHVERHQEMAVTTVFVCLACGYRFALRIG